MAINLSLAGAATAEEPATLSQRIANYWNTLKAKFTPDKTQKKKKKKRFTGNTPSDTMLGTGEALQ